MPTEGGMHVRLRVGRELYALPIESVLEVAELGALAPVPGAAACVLGVCNFNGQVLPVFDLAHVLGVGRDGRPLRLVVTEERGTLAGLAVDDVTDVAPLAGELEPTDADFLAHATLEAGSLVGVMDVPRVYVALGEGAR
jgi:chemotaxis signal transduction protein